MFGKSKRPPSPNYVVFLVGLGTAILLVGDVTLNLLLPIEENTIRSGILVEQVGLMLAANRIIRIFLNGPFGFLLDRIPRRRILIPSAFLAASTLMFYTQPGFWWVLTGRLLWGTAWAGFYVGGINTVLDVTTHKTRGRFVGRHQMWFFIGVASGSIIGGILFDAIGYFTTFRVLSIFMLSAGILWFFFLPETYDPDGTVVAPIPVDTNKPLLQTKPKPQPTKRSLNLNLPFIVAAMAMGLNWMVFVGGFGSTVPFLLSQGRGDTISLLWIILPTATFIGLVSASNQVVSLLVSPIAGWLSDWTGNRWGLVLLALLIGFTALGVGAYGAFHTNLPMSVAAPMLSAFAISLLQTQTTTLTGDHAPQGKQGRSIGILNVAADIGGATGPIIAYQLIPVIGLSATYQRFMVLIVLMLPFVVWMTYREARQQRRVGQQSAEPVR